MDRYMMRKSRLKGRPYSAAFELTPLCNFDCKMCYMHLTERQLAKAGRILSAEEWVDIIRQAIDAGVMSVDITGGECLLHPGFRDIYRYLVKRGVRVAILTNGQLLTEEMIDFFKLYPPSVVQISLYGSSPEAYIRVTGKDAFQDVLNAVDRLKKAKIPCRVTMTPHRFMQEDAAQMLDLLHRLGVKYDIAFGTLAARPETEREIEDYIVDNEIYREIKRIEAQYRKRVSNSKGTVETINPFTFRIKGEELFEGLPCYAGSAHFHINWKGEMTPCIPFYTISKSVLNGCLWEAWEWVRNIVKSYHLPDECNSCMYVGECSACPAERTQGRFNGPVNRFVCKRHKELNTTNVDSGEE